MRGHRRTAFTATAGAVTLLGACTASVPADVELVSVEAVRQETPAVPPGVLPAGFIAGEDHRPLRVTFASRVNLVRFVSVNNYSLNIETRYCDGNEATVGLVASGIYWQGTVLVPHGPDPIQAEKPSRDDLLGYTFFLNMDVETTHPGDICFNIAGSNADRGYRSNTVIIPGIELARALQP